MPDRQPGREEELHRLRRWLASAPARHARSLRAQLTAALARTALAVHREAAASTVARPPLEGQAEGQA